MFKASSFISIVIIVASVAYFIFFLTENIADIPIITWGWKSYAAIGNGLLLYVMLSLVVAYAWYLLLRSCGQYVRLPYAIMILFVSQMAKYLPGNVGHHISRVILARIYHLDAPRVIVSVTLEMAWGIVASAAVAIGALFIEGKSVFELPLLQSREFPIFLVIFIGIAGPIVGVWVLNNFRPRPLRKLLGDKPLKTPSYKVAIATCGLYMANLLVVGLILDNLARGMFSMFDHHILLFAGVYSTAWIAGFVTPGAPAGLGVREAIMVGALLPAFGAGVALGLTIFLRLITTFGDALVFVLGIIARKRMPPSVSVDG